MVTLPDLQLVSRNLSSWVWIGTLEIGFSDEVVGFEEVGVPWFLMNKDESLLEVLEFEDVGLCGFVNKDDNFTFEAVPEELIVEKQLAEELQQQQLT